MKVNVEKCKIMRITRKKSHLVRDYKINGQFLESVLIYKDLGLLTSSNLSWNSHIVHIILTTAQGWRSGESTRLPPMWPGFKSRRRRHMWVEFVVGSLPCSERFFSGYSGFPLSSKTNISKFQFDQ